MCCFAFSFRCMPGSATNVGEACPVPFLLEESRLKEVIMNGNQLHKSSFSARYPLVNVCITMERSTIL